ncbi:hypothetical protein NDU88_006499 [Pleurodeles waltl]|uniref:Uncharacterized protein n=1 Tax=Pleurodeles waltl TaxID=8319 RepID=A0AAV7LQW1_PLEWA|nr:hypothetical protein NDU88_006499 [Pleurodeles waltl]
MVCAQVGRNRSDLPVSGGGDVSALCSSNPEGCAHLHSSGERVQLLLWSSAVRGGRPAVNGTHGPPPPPQQLSSPPFGLVLLSSGAFMVQRWVEGSPPRVRLLSGHGLLAIRAGRGRLRSSASVSCLSHPVIEPLRSWSARGVGLKRCVPPGSGATCVFSTTSALRFWCLVSSN